MGLRRAASRALLFAGACGAALVAMETLTRALRLERLVPAPPKAFKFRPLLADNLDDKPLDAYRLPTERDGRTLTRVENVSIDDPELLYRLRPDAIWEKEAWTIVTNSMGLRDREVQVPRPEGERRVLCLGDSVTFGWQLEEADTWTVLLEGRLSAASRQGSFRVINGGVYGYSSTQGRRLLDEGALLRLSPDVCVLSFGLNDATGMGRALTDRLAETPRAPSRLLSRLALYRLLRGFLVPLRDGALLARAEQASLRLYRENLAAMVATLRGRGVEPVLVGQATVEGLGGQRLARLPDYRRAAAELAASEKVPFVDLAKAFGRHVPVVGEPRGGGGEARAYFVDACHPNAAGARLIAREMHRALAEGPFAGAVAPPEPEAP